MTIDANLIEGFKTGFGIGVAVGVILGGVLGVLYSLAKNPAPREEKK